jgi:beta-glucosidase
MHPVAPRATRLAVIIIGVVLAAFDAIDGAAQANEARRIEALLAQMTLAEKIGQLQQLDGEADGRYRPEHLDLARQGRLGSTLNVRGAARVNELQRAAVEQSRLKIPLIFAFDVIHGYRTVFPIPLGETASWDPEGVERAAAIAAAESRAAGVHWTFAPMVDIARDARWGRMAEGAGEDPYLGAVMARARVRGFQGDDYGRPDRVVACAKHWVGYGAAEAGRDYNTTDISEHTLRSVYFPPFKAALDAGAGTFMSAFNALNAMPSSANRWTLTGVLRDEWKFDGLVVSDYNSVIELVNHAIAADRAEAAARAMTGGVDMEMVSRTYAEHLERLVQQGTVQLAAIDEAVRRVLRIKLRAGLFDRPYAEPAREQATVGKAEFRTEARRAAARAMVLLENGKGVLPLAASLRRIAVVGPLADDRESTLGNWIGDGRPAEAVTVLEGIRAAVSPGTEVTHAQGVTLNVASMLAEGPAAADREAMGAAVRLSRDADATVLVLGETGAMSGEASSRSSLELPGSQLALAQDVLATGKPVVVVLMNGRPLALSWLAAHAPALLEAWFPGTDGGHAVADVIFGRVNPGGKLPVTFPRVTGQVPLYYNHLRTGRPPLEKEKYTSKYLDVPWTPLYPFGYGLSYTTFAVRDLRLAASRVARDGRVRLSVEVANTGSRDGDEVVQVYVQDVVASVARPVQELKAFQRVTLRAGESRRVEFALGPDALGFYNASMSWVVEPGEFRLRVGTSSADGLSASFVVE